MKKALVLVLLLLSPTLANAFVADILNGLIGFFIDAFRLCEVVRNSGFGNCSGDTEDGCGAFIVPVGLLQFQLKGEGTTTSCPNLDAPIDWTYTTQTVYLWEPLFQGFGVFDPVREVGTLEDGTIIEDDMLNLFGEILPDLVP